MGDIMRDTVSVNKMVSTTAEIIDVDWLQVPLAIWQIWKSLSTDRDRSKMQQVAREWYTELPKLMAPRPWIVGSNMVDGTFHCVNRNCLQLFKFKGNVPPSVSFSGSCQDFLILEAKLGCSLWNPGDGMVLPLPLESYSKIVMLETPGLLAFAYSPGKVTLSFGRLTGENKWQNIACADKGISDICQCGKEFYAVNCMFRIYRLDQQSGKMVMAGPVESSDEVRKHLPDGNTPDHILLANLNDELLVIALGRNLQSVQVFRVAWLDDQNASLNVITDLSGWSIFLGSNQSISSNASEFPGIHGNNLYIALEPLVDGPQTVQVYSLQARTIMRADYPEKLGIPFFYQPSYVSIYE